MRPLRDRLAAWVSLPLLGVALFVVYMSNGRNISAGDTVPSVLVAVSVLRGDGLVLDRFADYIRATEADSPTGAYYVSLERGHVVSRYPVATALLSVPLVAPQLFYVDRRNPGWERDIPAARYYLNAIDKNTAAFLATVAALCMLVLLRTLGFSTVAMLSTIIVALGSDMWTVASQSLWQHGPAALALALSLVLLSPASPSPARLALAGLATAVLPAVRVVDVLVAGALACWVARRHRVRSGWFLVPFVAVVVSVLAYNVRYFGHWNGGQHAIESLHPKFHAVDGIWSRHVLVGATGTLLSPSRGLLVFCPWVAGAIVVLPALVSRLRESPAVAVAMLALVPYWLALSTYSVWWAGHTFGPRYWTDVTPLLAVLLAHALAWSREGRRLVFGVIILGGVMAIGIQALGAFCYPSSWNLHPTNVDQDHARLWDWRDSEPSRAFKECVWPRLSGR